MPLAGSVRKNHLFAGQDLHRGHPAHRMVVVIRDIQIPVGAYGQVPGMIQPGPGGRTAVAGIADLAGTAGHRADIPAGIHFADRVGILVDLGNVYIAARIDDLWAYGVGAMVPSDLKSVI